MIKLIRNSRGDTIVEVMIAVLVLGAVLASAYTLSNRSLGGVRDSQEHAEGLKVAETQLEQLKQVADTPGNPGRDMNGTSIYSSNNFCITLDAGGYNIRPNTDAECNSFGIGVPYRVSIGRTNSGDSHTFRVNVRWDSTRANNINFLSLSYNLDQ